MLKLNKKITCRYCSEPIDTENEKYVLLGTYDKGNPQDESFYHFSCFVKWYNSKIKERTDNVMTALKDKAFGILRSVKSVHGNVSGSEETDSKITVNIADDVINRSEKKS